MHRLIQAAKRISEDPADAANGMKALKLALNNHMRLPEYAARKEQFLECVERVRKLLGRHGWHGHFSNEDGRQHVYAALLWYTCVDWYICTHDFGSDEDILKLLQDLLQGYAAPPQDWAPELRSNFMCQVHDVILSTLSTASPPDGGANQSASHQGSTGDDESDIDEAEVVTCIIYTYVKKLHLNGQGR